MGRTVRQLSLKALNSKPIFNKRFVVEVCEKMHVHYRNLRLMLSVSDFIAMAEGMKDALTRWAKLGEPEPGKKHIELCRKVVGINDTEPNVIKINYNRNLYPQHDGKIFSDGASFEDPMYIHLKVRDQRMELSLEEFHVLTQAVKEADSKLNEGSSLSSVPQTS